MTITLQTVISADGTRIAFERTGDGPAVILVGGAFNDRSTVAGLATVLSGEMTAVCYDRRGRGDSGDREDVPGDIIRPEIEDLAAVIGAVGGEAAVFGHSSGAALALRAAAAGLAVRRLAVYEPPFVVPGTRKLAGADLVDRVRAHLAAGRRDEAAALFLSEGADAPAGTVEAMRSGPMWDWFTGLAHTLPRDLVLCGTGGALPAAEFAGIAVPTLVFGGGTSPAWMPAGARAVADAIPGARYETVEGEDHGVLHHPEALRRSLLDFFLA